MTQANHCELYTRLASKSFTRLDDPAASRELMQYLDALDRDTSLHAIEGPDEIRMRIGGGGVTVRRGYRYTAAAFQQAARILAPGLSRFLLDVAGTNMRQISMARPCTVDGDAAIRIWNQMVTMRFNLFERYRAIRNEQSRTIDGFVTMAHQYLGNAAMYREAVDAVASGPAALRPYAAKLTGRQFAIWFRDQQPRFRLAVDDKTWGFYGGLHLTNGEATGVAVRGTAAVLTPKGVCLSPQRQHTRRVSHTGQDFMSRLGAMLATMAGVELPWDKIETHARSMLTTSLGFTEDARAEQRTAIAKRLVSSLMSQGVMKNIAVEVIDLAMAAGRHLGSPVMEMQRLNQVYTGRTIFDVFVPLLQLAKRVSGHRRGVLERAAYEMLTGRFNCEDKHATTIVGDAGGSTAVGSDGNTQ